MEPPLRGGAEAPSIPRPTPRWVRPLVLAALGLFLPLAVLLRALGPLALRDALFLAFLLLPLPAVSVAQVPLVRDEPLARVPVYLGSGGAILFLGALSLVLGMAGGGAGALGLTPLAPTALAAWTAGLAAAGLAVIAGSRTLGRALGVPETRVLVELLPRTSGERSAFAFLSLAAGVGEELAYRGYAIWALTAVTGSPWAAAAVSSAAFGFLHAYQGPVGVARTAAMGMLLAASLVLTGSLWPAVLAHVAIDLLAGLLLGERLVR